MRSFPHVALPNAVRVSNCFIYNKNKKEMVTLMGTEITYARRDL